MMPPRNLNEVMRLNRDGLTRLGRPGLATKSFSDRSGRDIPAITEGVKACFHPFNFGEAAVAW